MISPLAVLQRVLLAFAALACVAPAIAESNFSTQALPAEKESRPESFRKALGTLPIRTLQLGAIDPAEIDAAKRANTASTYKSLQIGVGRQVPPDPAAESASLAWERVAGGVAAHWEVTSPGAHALRVGLVVQSMQPGVEIRFGAREGGPVYGPFSAAEVVEQSTYWSPVLAGETAIIEIFVGEGTLLPVITITQISHLFASPADPRAEILLKDGSGPCEIDLICRSATDAALANVGKAVARMTYTDGGSTFLCTGTLLNPTGAVQTPFFYSANHCFDTQTVASTLTTHWFYDRTGCGSGGVGASYVQLPGGATLLYANEPSDALLLRLNNTPPAGAVYAGWDSDTLLSGTALTAVHHPAGDWKKVSLGSMGGFQTVAELGGSFIKSNWSSGVTEGGSSGSGIFTPFGQPTTDYRLRGGLLGGPSLCTEQTFDFYSRFDLVYPEIQQFLSPTSSIPPAAPIIGTTSLNDRTATVSFTPGPLGSGTLIRYTADCGGLTNTGPGSPIAVPGLSYGVTYACRASATTTVGTSAFSAPSNAVTPLLPEDGFPPSGTVPAGWVQPSGSNAPWVVASGTAYAGSQSLKSGSIANSQKSDISYIGTLAGGTLSFARKVSSEANFDFLEFYIDGVRKDRWSGEVPFAVVSYPISAAAHTLLWRYVKDESDSAGSDGAWIDSVVLPGVVATTPVVEYLNTADFPNSPGGHFFYSSDPAEQAAVDAGAAGAFVRTGRSFNTGGTSPVCRFYGSVTPGPNSHFFTVNVDECNALKALQVTPTPAGVQQWNYERIEYATTPVNVVNGTQSCPAGTLPLYRAYNNAFPLSGPKNPWDSNHRFTPAQSDIAALVAGGWRAEGIVFCTAN